MYTLVAALGIRDAGAKEMPALLTALVIAEIFYKFHSFTLECAAFLATWLALSWLQAGFVHRVVRSRRTHGPSAPAAVKKDVSSCGG